MREQFKRIGNKTLRSTLAGAATLTVLTACNPLRGNEVIVAPTPIPGNARNVNIDAQNVEVGPKTQAKIDSLAATAVAKAAEKTDTTKPSKPNLPRTSRPLPVGQWTKVRTGEIVAGDIDTGSVKHDDNANTGMVSGPFLQDMMVRAPWGATASTAADQNDAIDIRNEIAKEMLRSGCGTGVGCPDGVTVTDGVSIVTVISK